MPGMTKKFEEEKICSYGFIKKIWFSKISQATRVDLNIKIPLHMREKFSIKSIYNTLCIETLQGYTYVAPKLNQCLSQTGSPHCRTFTVSPIEIAFPAEPTPTSAFWAKYKSSEFHLFKARNSRNVSAGSDVTSPVS